LKNWSIEEGKKQTKKEIITSIAGACILLLGLFLILTFHQILPFGINSLGGQIAGYVCSSAGLIALLVGVIKGCINRRHNTDVESVMHTYYLAEASEMGSYFPNRLLPDELFAVQDSLRKIITIMAENGMRMIIVMKGYRLSLWNIMLNLKQLFKSGVVTMQKLYRANVSLILIP